MADRSSDRAHPAEQLLALSHRTLLILHAAFWISLVLYGGILLAFALLHRPLAAEAVAQPWGLLQFGLLAAGLAAAVLARRLHGAWLAPERIWEGSTSLEALADDLAQRGKAPRETPPAEAHGRRMSQAVQHLLGRLITAHLIPWALAEVAAVLGLVERFVTGGQSLAPVMVLISAAALFLTRPDRARLREIMDPIFRTPVRS